MAKVEDSQIHHHHVRIKIIGPTPPTTMAADNHNNVQRFFLCAICKKAFTSVYALNGHTRMHSHSQKGNVVTAAKTNNNVVSVKTCDGGLSERSSTTKPSFPSAKTTLFPLINPHPQTLMRRDITPCQNIWSGRRFNIAAAMAAAEGDVDTFCHSSSAVERSGVYLCDGSVFKPWPLSCKRIRKPRLSGRRRRRGNSCSEVEVDPLMLEAAETLMLLANGGDFCGDQAEFSSAQRNRGTAPKRMMMQGEEDMIMS